MTTQISELALITVRIEGDGGRGTGFLVSRDVEDKGRQHFLVTNKHVLHENPVQRRVLEGVALNFNRKSGSGDLEPLEVALSLADRAGIPRFVEHPDADVDVLALELTDVIVRQDPECKSLSVHEHLIGAAERSELTVGLGDEVFTLGYPLGLRQGGSNLPLLRLGMVATDPGGVLEDTATDSAGGTRQRRRPAFLIDGATIPGSSGSPVLLRTDRPRLVGGRAMYGGPPSLLGIVAKGQQPPIGPAALAPEAWHGLGLAFPTETILETLDLFPRYIDVPPAKG